MSTDEFASETDEYVSEVIGSHIIKCPVCDGTQAVVLIWNDGDVDLIYTGCRKKERFSID